MNHVAHFKNEETKTPRFRLFRFRHRMGFRFRRFQRSLRKTSSVSNAVSKNTQPVSKNGAFVSFVSSYKKEE
jgi:hypothetical protein